MSSGFFINRYTVCVCIMRESESWVVDSAFVEFWSSLFVYIYLYFEEKNKPVKSVKCSINIEYCPYDDAVLRENVYK